MCSVESKVNSGIKAHLVLTNITLPTQCNTYYYIMKASGGHLEYQRRFSIYCISFCWPGSLSLLVSDS